MAHSYPAESLGSFYERPSIIVINRSPFLRSCVARILRSEFEEFSIVEIEAAQQLDATGNRLVGLVALDIASSAMTDDEVLRDLACVRRSSGDVPVVLFTSRDEASIPDAVISEVMRFGARGYVTQSTSIEIALAAIRLVIAGGVHFPRSMSIDSQDLPVDTAAALPSPVPAPAVELPAAPNTASFTERERQVLASLLRGMSNKVIAGELNLSQNTVKSHISRIMQKLHARNRTEAVILSQYSGVGPNGAAHGGVPDA
ncbi:LuxR C-terminal-related transcriptional regulator [Arvimicrobium flavum]|uniref:LuxR C-terminal-related transcriptional regulator n=1 Tax=Arvimicrobium flavum TaxID=3393320 RepID=UPI00237B489E|nr:response regulator transcription factor [Mesorhizobium shangrilense]